MEQGMATMDVFHQDSAGDNPNSMHLPRMVRIIVSTLLLLVLEIKSRIVRRIVLQSAGMFVLADLESVQIVIVPVRRQMSQITYPEVLPMAGTATTMYGALLMEGTLSPVRLSFTMMWTRGSTTW